MNPKIVAVLFLFKTFSCAEISSQNRQRPALPWLKHSNLRRAESVRKVAPEYQGFIHKNKSNERGSIFPSWLFGGNKDAVKVAPENSQGVMIEPANTQKSSKVAPHDINQLKPTTAIVTENLRKSSRSSDETCETCKASSIDSNSSADSNEIAIENLSAKEIKRLYSECSAYTRSKNFESFKRAMNRLKPFLNDTKILKLLKAAVQSDLTDFVRFLFENFHLLSTLPSDLIFEVLDKRQSDILELIIEHRINTDSNLTNGSGMHPYEVAAKMNYAEGLEFMINHWSDTKLAWLPKALNIALEYESVDALAVILNALKESSTGKTLDSILSKSTLLRKITKTLLTRNRKLLKPLIKSLSKTFLNDIDDHKCKWDEKSFDPVRKAIEMDYTEGLQIMVKHFGVEILKKLDNLGYSSFLVAAHYLSPDTARYIASVCPELIHSIDTLGNNALHLAFNHECNPLAFVHSIADLGIDWDRENDQGKSAVDLMLDNEFVTDAEIENIYEKYIEK